ncbi:MAG TPA: hypothetical protein VGM08_03940 [Candidatus Saccharimonadales bacterium]|jgi:hypothetical protein
MTGNVPIITISSDGELSYVDLSAAKVLGDLLAIHDIAAAV